MAKVTVAVPTYNREKFLKQAIESVLKQTFQDFEIIVFDNASSYNIERLLAGFGDKRISLNKTPENIGQVGNFQRIYNYPYTSRYMMILFDDYAIHPQLLEREAGLLEANKELVWAGSSLRFVREDKDMGKFSPITGPVPYKICDSSELTRQILLGFNLCFGSIVYRVSAIEDPFDLVTKYSKWSDRPQVIRIAQKGKAALINAPLINYRLHAGQDSAQKDSEQFFIDYSKKLFQFYKDSLPQPLSSPDAALWYKFTTNNLLNAVAGISHTAKDFWLNLNKFRPDFFNWKYLRPKGIFYLLKFFKKFYI